MYPVSAQGVDERMINVHYYYYSNWNRVCEKECIQRGTMTGVVAIQKGKQKWLA